MDFMMVQVGTNKALRERKKVGWHGRALAQLIYIVRELASSGGVIMRSRSHDSKAQRVETSGARCRCAVIAY